MRLLKWIVVVLALAVMLPAGAQEDPDQMQTYRLIRVDDAASAVRMRWIETWESQDRRPGQQMRQIVMVDAQARGLDGGIDATCYYAISRGDNVLHYMVDGERVVVDDADAFWHELSNRKVFDQARRFVMEDVDCTPGETAQVNGLPAQACHFEGEDAFQVFLVKLPATSRGTLWTATEGGFPVKYHFEAAGELNRAVYEYEAYVRDFTVEPPEDIGLMCFDGGFPALDVLEPVVTNSMTYAAFTSDLSEGELCRALDAALLGAWQSVDREAGGARAYIRTLPSGSDCRLVLRFSPRPDAPGTAVTASVYPNPVNLEDAPLPDLGPIVVQSAIDVDWCVAGGVQAALDAVLPDQEAAGWVVREELTDRREDSALVTLASSDGLEEMHVIVELRGEDEACIRLQTRQAVCGPVF